MCHPHRPTVVNQDLLVTVTLILILTTGCNLIHKLDKLLLLNHWLQQLQHHLLINYDVFLGSATAYGSGHRSQDQHILLGIVLPNTSTRAALITQCAEVMTP